MKTHVAVHTITGGARVERKKDDTSAPTNLQTVAAGEEFDPRELGIGEKEMARMIERGAVRESNAGNGKAAPAAPATATGNKV